MIDNSNIDIVQLRKTASKFAADAGLEVDELISMVFANRSPIESISEFWHKCRFESLDWLRSESRRLDGIVGVDGSEDDNFEDIETKDLLNSVIYEADLNKTERDVLFFVFYTGKTHRQIEEELSISQYTFKQTLQCAIRKLQRVANIKGLINGE